MLSFGFDRLSCWCWRVAGIISYTEYLFLLCVLTSLFSLIFSYSALLCNTAHILTPCSLLYTHKYRVQQKVASPKKKREDYSPQSLRISKCNFTDAFSRLYSSNIIVKIQLTVFWSHHYSDATWRFECAQKPMAYKHRTGCKTAVQISLTEKCGL